MKLGENLRFYVDLHPPKVKHMSLSFSFEPFLELIHIICLTFPENWGTCWSTLTALYNGQTC